jgi:hypothetical protein
MKKTIALLLFTLLSAKQYAQIEKGTYVPSISINGTYNTRPYSDTIYGGKTNSFNLGSTLGFGSFIKDNLLLMGNLSYTHSQAKSDYTYDAANNSYRNYGSSSFGNTESIGASLLHYKFLTENFAIRYGGSFSVNYTESINRNYNYTRGTYYPLTATYGPDVLHNTSTYSNSLGVQLNLLAGIQYFVSKNLALTGTMGFFAIADSYSPYQHVKKQDTHTLSASLTPSFNAFSVGITYYFRPKAAVAK